MGRWGRFEWGVFLVVLFVVLAFAVVVRPFVEVNVWLSGNLLMALAWLAPLIVLHELAHALVARLVRLRVFWIRIGVGRPLLETRVGATRLTLHAIPFGGSTTFAGRDTSWLRTRLFVAILAGPASHALWIAVATLLLGPTRLPWDELPNAPSPSTTFVLANAFLLIVNLLPASRALEPSLNKSDGSNLFAILRAEPAGLDTVLLGHAAMEAQDLFLAGRHDESIEIYRRLLREQPEDWGVRHDLAVVLAKTGDAESAREIFQELLESDDVDRVRANRLILDNNLAYADALIGDEAGLARADELSCAALERAPRTSVLQGTRGAVLARLNREREAIEHLENAYRLTSVPDGRAMTAAWLAFAHARLGDRTAAECWLARTEEHPELREVRLARAELARLSPAERREE